MTSRIKANEIDALTAGSALTVNAIPTFTKNATFSKNIIASANATISGAASVTGTLTTAAITSSGIHTVNFNGGSTQAFKYTDTAGGNLASFGQFYNTSDGLIANMQNANNDGLHFNIKNGSIVFAQTGYVAANALDDYEEGNWDPSVGGNATYSAQAGLYVKIGQHVYAAFDLTIDTLGTGSSSILGGLPFTVNSGVTMTPTMGIHPGYCSYYSGIATSVESLDCYAINAQTNIYFTGHNAGAAANIGNALSVLGNSARCCGAVHYTSAA